MPGTDRSSVIQNYFLSLDGVVCGILKSVEGGGISAAVIQEPAGQDDFIKKHIGPPNYEDVLLQIDFSLDRAVYDWITAAWSGKFVRKDVAIFGADSQMQVVSQREFFKSLITEITIPAMDASSKEPGYITLRLTPEYSRSTKLPGETRINTSQRQQKSWLPSNFRLDIGGLDCSRVSKLDALTVKQTVVQDDIGEMREYIREPGKLEFPNLKVTLAESFAQSFIDWHNDFVIMGNSGESQEKTGSISLFDPSLTELARINFFNLGIFRLVPEKAQIQADQIKKIVFEMYCERIEFVYPGK
jgi:hypothetical protein